MSDGSLVTFSSQGPIARIVLNRPQKLNALSLELMEQFHGILQQVRVRDDISVAIITGEGRALSVGADLAYLHNLGSGEQFRKDLHYYWHRNYNAIEEMEKVFIAALNGMVLGGALEMALACDFRLAVAGSQLGMPQINYGLIPDSGGTNRLAKLIGAGPAKEMVFSGESISTERALALGLLDRIYAEAEFEDGVTRFAHRFSDKSPVALGLGKLAINRGRELDVQSGLGDAAVFQSALLDTEPYLAAMRRFQEGSSDH